MRFLTFDLNINAFAFLAQPKRSEEDQDENLSLDSIPVELGKTKILSYMRSVGSSYLNIACFIQDVLFLFRDREEKKKGIQITSTIGLKCKSLNISLP